MSKFLNISTDTTLGGNSASDEVVSSQKAVKDYVDSHGGGSYTAGTGIDISNDVISVTSPTLTNTATGTNSLTIGGTATTYSYAVNIGENSSAYNIGVAVGYASSAGSGVSIGYASEGGTQGVGVGSSAKATGNSSIQIGQGTNSTDATMNVGFAKNNTNYTLLDGTTGLIPDARISSNIARTTDIPAPVTETTVSGWGFTKNAGTVTSVNNSSPDVNGNVTLSIPTVDQTYDGTSANAQSGVAIASVLGNIESAINTIRGV